jgi:hypothetical protein
VWFVLCAAGGLAILVTPVFGKGSFVVSQTGLMEMVCNAVRKPGVL